jgi:hypothetical protein
MSGGTLGSPDRFSLQSAQRILVSPVTWWTSLAAIVAILLFPLLLTDVPPLLDYPNHLARIFILKNAPEDPVLSRMYAPHWSIIPNLAVDVLGFLFLHIVPIHVAGRMVVGISVLMPVIGLIYYARTISGVRSYWPFGAALLGYNSLLLLGFLSFQIGLGLAFVAAAIWHLGREDHLWRTTLTVAILSVAVFFCHILGLVFLAILLCADEAVDPHTWQNPRHFSVRLSAFAFVFATPVILYFLSDLAADSNSAVWISTWHEKLLSLFQPFLNYDWRLDITTAVVVVGALYVGFVMRAGTLSRPAGFAFLFAMLLFTVAPNTFKGGTYFENRFLLFAMFLLFACYVPKRIPTVFTTATGSAIALLFLARMALLGFAWHGHADDVAQLREAIAAVAPGTRVLVVSVGSDVLPADWATRRWRAGVVVGFRRTDSHLPGLLVIERRAFWPLLFAVPSQHPVRVLSPYRLIPIDFGELPDYSLLAKDHLSANELRAFPYFSQWSTSFDDVLVLNSRGLPDLESFLPDKLQLIHATHMAALFRIRKQ